MTWTAQKAGAMNPASPPGTSGRTAEPGSRLNRRACLQRIAGLSWCLAGLVACGAPAAPAKEPARVPRIGFLSTAAGPSPVVEAFQQGLHELGYVEGQTITIEYRWAAGNNSLLAELAAELVRLPVDVIVPGSTPAISAAKNATRTIPIVMPVSADPVEQGLIASLARPGGNITGLTSISLELSGKRLELLKEAVPGVSRVAVLWNPTNPAKPLEWRNTDAAARTMGIQLLSLEVREPGDFEGAFEAATREGAEALVVLGDPLTVVHQARIVELATRNGLPAMYETPESAYAGGLMAYGPNRLDLFRRAAVYVDRILKGAKPSDLPVERPTTFDLVINLKAAQALGLAIPQPVLRHATAVIQ